MARGTLWVGVVLALAWGASGVPGQAQAQPWGSGEGYRWRDYPPAVRRDRRWWGGPRFRADPRRWPRSFGWGDPDRDDFWGVFVFGGSMRWLDRLLNRYGSYYDRWRNDYGGYPAAGWSYPYDDYDPWLVAPWMDQFGPPVDPWGWDPLTGMDWGDAGVGADPWGWSDAYPPYDGGARW